MYWLYYTTVYTNMLLYCNCVYGNAMNNYKTLYNTKTLTSFHSNLASIIYSLTLKTFQEQWWLGEESYTYIQPVYISR